jgi:hypothetical protein
MKIGDHVIHSYKDENDEWKEREGIVIDFCRTYIVIMVDGLLYAACPECLRVK